jgi:hypothetical protein
MSVFLCIQKNINYFECRKFNDFIQANNYFIEKYKNDNTVVSTMISVCKYLPLFIQNYIINYKLKQLFVKSEIIK